jgi:hypothetical protein
MRPPEFEIRTGSTLRQTGGRTDLPTRCHRVSVWEYVVAQSDSRDCAGKVSSVRRGIETVFTVTLL